jgi:hypothetical protein
MLKYIVDHKNAISKTEALYNLANLNKKDIPPAKIFSDHREGKNELFNSLMPEEFFKTDEVSEKLITAE